MTAKEHVLSLRGAKRRSNPIFSTEQAPIILEKVSLLLALTLLVGNILEAEEPLEALRESSGQVVQKVLDNGLVILVQERHASPTVSVRVVVRTGSLYEGRHLGSGISHLVEHLVASGATATRTEDEQERLLAAIGGNSNAYTSQEMTTYFINTEARYVTKAIELVSDWVLHASIPEGAFDREKKVVLQEQRQGLSQPTRVLWDLAATNMFRVHPAGMPVIGYPELMERITRDDVITYYREKYVPNNMVFVVAGDVGAAEAIAEVEKEFKGVPRGPESNWTLPEEPAQLSRRVLRKDFPVGLAYLRMDFRTVPLSHPDLYPLDILSFILSEGESSRLVKKLRDEEKLVSSIATYSYTPGYNGGFFGIDIRTEPEKLELAQEAVLRELSALRNNPPTDSEMARAKMQKIRDHVLSSETPEDLASRIATDYVSALDPEFSLAYTENIQKVAKDEVLRVLDRYFRPENLCVSIVATPQEAEAPTAPLEVARPPVKKFTLPNGLVVLVGEDHSSKLVTISASFLGGVRFETEATGGLSNFTTKLLLKGTPKRTAFEIASSFEDMGGVVSATSGNNSFYLSATVLSSEFEKALAVLADCIKNSSFPPEEIENERRILVSAIEARQDDPLSEAFHFFRRTLFQVSPYRLSPGGEAESIKAITGDELLRFYKSYCVPNNMVLAVFGDVDEESASALADKYLFDFPKKEDLTFPKPPEEPALLKSVRHVEKTNKTRAIVIIGYLGMRTDNAQDLYPMEVLDAILSGVNYPRGWLHTELRGKGLVYEVHAFNQAGLEPGFFAIYAICDPDKADKVSDIILANVRKMKGGNFSQGELDLAKGLCIATQALSLQTNAERALDASLNELYGLGFDYSNKYAERIESVTREDVVRVARKYLVNQVLTILAPGVR